VSTQGKILFVGDSHTYGYWHDSAKEFTHTWSKNNYAQIYATDIAESQCYVYALASAANEVYPKWIRYMMNIHSDISAVVLQTTYWDRWMMGSSTTFEFDELSLDHFTKICHRDNNVILYSDDTTVNYENIQWPDKVKFDYIKENNSFCPEYNGGGDWPGYAKNYMSTKFHHEILTHLTYEKYNKDIALIDSMCAAKDIPCYVWRINDRVEIPKTFDTFRDLTQTKVLRQPANMWIKENLNIDIDTMRLDGEHYNIEAHKLIAHNFIPELLK
jgi:hypothetical protein